MPLHLFRHALLYAVICLPSLEALAKERYLAEIPDACELLPSTLAQTFLGQAVAERSKEHIDDFYSQCFYKGIDQGGHMVGFDFKFMTRRMFDTETLPQELIDINASFATGGKAHSERQQFPGKLTYVFHDKDYTWLLVLTGITAPAEASGVERTLIANYQLIHPGLSRDERRDLLLKQAWQHLGKWFRQASGKE